MSESNQIELTVKLGHLSFLGQGVPGTRVVYDERRTAWIQVHDRRPARPQPRARRDRTWWPAMSPRVGYVVGALLLAVLVMSAASWGWTKLNAPPHAELAAAQLPPPLPEPAVPAVALPVESVRDAALTVEAQPYAAAVPVQATVQASAAGASTLPGIGGQVVGTLQRESPVSPAAQSLPAIGVDQAAPTAPAPVALKPQTVSATKQSPAPAKPETHAESMVVFNEAQATPKPPVPATTAAVSKVEQRGGRTQILLAIKDATTIVVSDPRSGMPTAVRVGDTLPNGARLSEIDVKGGVAKTTSGNLRLE